MRISDEELTRQALAADAEPDVPADAEPFVVGQPGAGLLPEWYMPVPQGSGRSPRRLLAVAGIVGALIIVNGAGLCVTYGFPEIAW